MLFAAYLEATTEEALYELSEAERCFAISEAMDNAARFKNALDSSADCLMASVVTPNHKDFWFNLMTYESIGAEHWLVFFKADAYAYLNKIDVRSCDWDEIEPGKAAFVDSTLTISKTEAPLYDALVNVDDIDLSNMCAFDLRYVYEWIKSNKKDSMSLSKIFVGVPRSILDELFRHGLKESIYRFAGGTIERAPAPNGDEGLSAWVNRIMFEDYFCGILYSLIYAKYYHKTTSPMLNAHYFLIPNAELRYIREDYYYWLEGNPSEKGTNAFNESEFMKMLDTTHSSVLDAKRNELVQVLAGHQLVCWPCRNDLCICGSGKLFKNCCRPHIPATFRG